MIRLAIFAAAALAVASPALAQISEDEAKAFTARYVKLFNTGDALALAKDVYALPGVSVSDMTTKLAERFDALRGDEFGKLVLFGFSTCKATVDTATLEMRYALQYTYGGNMPPGDQVSVFGLARQSDGWRIVAVREAAAGDKPECGS